MKKTKVAPKATKSKTAKKTVRRSNAGVYATEHDFIIIVGGGLVVLMLTVFLFVG